MLSEIRGYMQTDQFHPEKLLAGGPSAKVYRGVETATGRKVLIKSLLPEHETPHALDRERLQLMAPALMQLRHPQITGLITLIPTEEEFAIVSEFMPGMNIRALAATRQISAADLRALAVQFMHALLVGEHLRQPHGDPKPSNVIIADHPGGGLFLQVQDWGLSLTRSVHPEETLWFRAPELHHTGVPTMQSDLFTAAASLFCLATNSAPAQGTLADDLVRQWHAFQAGPALAHMRPDIDPPLRDWLAWLLQPNPQMRPQCVAHALDAMVTIQTGFLYMPQQVPQMMPGSQTAPLVAAPVARTTPLVSLPQNPNAPRPKPIVPRSGPGVGTKSGALAAGDDKVGAATATTTAAPAKKRSGKRVFAAVTLNLVALVLAGFFFLPAIVGANWPAWLPLPPGQTLPGKPPPDTATSAAPPPATSKPGAPAPAAPAAPAVLKGRYVRIELKGKATALNLAEVQIFSGEENVASQGKPSQSSVAFNGKAELAIDGNTDGDMPKTASVMHTDANKNDPWWQIDLGQEVPLNSIVLWNRTDGDFGERTKNLTVKVLSAHQRVIWEKKGCAKPEPELKIPMVVGE
ncbi:MAG: protein kinase domain-containing protein [Prosthecobacter sp.]